MAKPPTGTVTFLYTDLEGSTARWERQPAAMRAAVARHDALLRAAIAAHDGHVFRGTGDGLCAAFATAPDALAAALAAQRALHAEPWGEATGPLRARMALHTGAVELVDGDYVGACLNRVGRLLAAAHGGQALLSQATADLARDALPAGAGLRPLGEHRLRDLVRPEPVYQLVHADLLADFPALRSLDAFPHNLPLQLTSFVGREREIAEVARLLGAARLLTLTGAGGCGKTRLALQVAADLVEGYPDGAWFVDLAPLADGEVAPATVAAVLGVREQPGQPLLTTLQAALKEKRLLLVLDNCEHVLDAGAQLTEALLRGCPGLRVLTTSRELLGVAGEVAWRVPSLALPDGTHLPPLDQLERCEAVRLFAERARLLQPAFALTAQNAAAVAQVCRRLDGIPLALELAAARVTALSVEQIAARLDDRFRLLTGGRRTAVRRQQTLAAAIDWSYALLTEAERALVRRLSVFAGGWTLEAAEAVGAGDGVAGWEVVDLLTRLVEKSLVLAEEQGDATRYRLLETVRQYAAEKLAAAGEAATVRDRHGAWCLALVEQTEPELDGPRRGAWLERLEVEHDNLRAALEWSEADGQADRALRLAGSAGGFWKARGHLTEGRQRLARLLTRPETAAPTAARMKALYAAATVARQSDVAQRAYVEDGLAIARQLGDQLATLEGLGALVWWHAARAEHAQARALAEPALALARALDHRRWVARLLYSLSLEPHLRGDIAPVRELFHELLALYRDLGDPDKTSNTLNDLGLLEWREGDDRLSRAYQTESLRLRWELRDVRGVAACLDCFAGLAATGGRPEQAVRLAGVVAKVRATYGIQPAAVWPGFFVEAMARARRELGEPAAAAAWAEGQALTLEAAVAEALAEEPATD